MASSRFDNIRYYDGGFKIPSQIQVWDGSKFVDLGKKDSFNKTKLNATADGSSFFCATYYRNDVDIPKTINIGSGKYIDLNKSNGSNLPVDTYNADYRWEMYVAVYSSTPLYTAYTRNQGDIINQSYTNYVAQVSGNKVRLKVSTHFSGNRISDGKYVDATTTKYTDYVFTVGEKVRILMTQGSASGPVRVRIYNPAGTLLTDVNIAVNTQWVGTPNKHFLGSETTSKSGGQSTYGNAKISSFSVTPVNDRSQRFTLNFEGTSNNAKTIYSSGSYGGYGSASGTSVYGSKYTEYIRQTI